MAKNRAGLRVDLWLKGRQADLVREQAAARGFDLTTTINAMLHEWGQVQRQRRGDEYRRGMLEDLVLLQAAEQQLRSGINGREREDLRQQRDDAAQRIRSRIAMIAAV